ncbi:MAG: hypothetical protein A3B70_05735 [Deltaproteobacteria bacterium RIFCSPHIGHO2_02_FULL_40_11]|nr:MAG: hypothetical protein A3B70_05735 [Deltaproteobacteria bacterium RIFCSPHIGHO2_02_FULL_40_11]
MNVEAYQSRFLYHNGRFEEGLVLEVSGGTIVKVSPKKDCKVSYIKDLGDVALIPGTINTHTHSFQSLVRGFGDDMDFFDWRDQGIYKYSLNLSKDDIYVGALFAFGEMLKHGITTVCDFFYIQNQGNENARAVIQAAKDLGIRLVLARCFYDWKKAPIVYQETATQASERCLELMKLYQDDPMVTIYPAPHSLHAASPEMIQAGFEVAKTTNTMFHMHLAEGQYEVEQVKKEKGKAPLFYLNDLGVVCNKMVAVHGVWLTDPELDLMAQNNVKLSYNPSSNMFLADGVTPIQKMLDRNITIGLGTDGACSNNKTSIFEEMRMSSLLQKVHLLDGKAIGALKAFEMGTLNGGIVLGLPIGKLEPGYQADFITLKTNQLELQPIQNLKTNIVYAFSSNLIQDVYVHGKKVVSSGELQTVPEPKILDLVQKVTRAWS